MKRRDFFAASAAAGLALKGTTGTASAAPMNKDIYELRVYHFASQAKLGAFDAFMKKATVPALSRLGIGPVGVFRLPKADNPRLKLEEDSTNLFVLLPHKSLESVLGMNAQLGEDGAFMADGADVLEAPKADPAYRRFESSLFLAFDNMPRLEVPSKSPDRLLQLRIYESHTTERHFRKTHMFNEGGEIAIFRRTGLNPVFFGQAIVGSKLPTLTYMIGFDNAEAMKKAWNKFRVDPGWIQIKDAPEYKDTVSNITNLILRPASSSQI